MRGVSKLFIGNVLGFLPANLSAVVPGNLCVLHRAVVARLQRCMFAVWLWFGIKLHGGQ